MSSLEGRMSRVEAAVEGGMSGIAAARAALARMQQDIQVVSDGFEKAISDMQAELDDVKNRVSALEAHDSGKAP